MPEQLLRTIVDQVLTRPAPLQACTVPHEVVDRAVNAEIETVVANHKMMTELLVMALACDQSRVFNMMFNNGASSLTRIGSTITHHQLTHEEVLDQKLGYQPEATWFLTRIMEAWGDFVGALDAVREGDRTLFDNTLVFAHSETEFAKFHTVDNLPMMSAGSGGGRIKTGIYVDGAGSPISPGRADDAAGDGRRGRYLRHPEHAHQPRRDRGHGLIHPGVVLRNPYA